MDFPGAGLIDGIISKNFQPAVRDFRAGNFTADARPEWSWDNGSDAQKWTRTAQGELKRIGGRCLDIDNSGTADGTRIRRWSCNGTAAQRWTVSYTGWAN